jgi:omega-6 fatty acid desaturase (delta-12 desaturase)
MAISGSGPQGESEIKPQEKSHSPSQILTRQDLADVIPPHCFERSNWTSFSYILTDLIMVSIGFYCGTYLSLLPDKVQYILWPMYWFVQGTFMTGLWVLAHEAGHRALSESVLFNDFFGFTLHSALLVPFHSWRITHGTHHAYTSHLDKDQVFVPKEKDPEQGEILRDSPLVNLVSIVAMLTIGWPLYLFFNFSGGRLYYGKRANHFEPASPLFNIRQYWLIVLSNAGLLGMLGILAILARTYGVMWVCKWYVCPYLVVNFWLVLITFLQHKHKDVKYYEPDSWDYISGALQTVDRKYGLVDIILHHITDTHVCHHVFHQIPFYHAQEATIAIKKFLGEKYLFDDTPIFIALWNASHEFRFVEGAGIKSFAIVSN